MVTNRTTFRYKPISGDGKIVVVVIIIIIIIIIIIKMSLSQIRL